MEGQNKSTGGNTLYWGLGILAFVLLAGFGMWWYKRSKTPSIMQPNSNNANNGSSSDSSGLAALLSKFTGGNRGGGGGGNGAAGDAIKTGLNFSLDLLKLFGGLGGKKDNTNDNGGYWSGNSDFADGSYITDGNYYDANGYPQGTVDGSGNIINSSGTIIGNQDAGPDGLPSTDNNGQYAGPGPWDNSGTDGSSQTYVGPYNYDNNGGFGDGTTYDGGPWAPPVEYGPGY